MSSMTSARNQVKVVVVSDGKECGAKTVLHSSIAKCMRCNEKRSNVELADPNLKLDKKPFESVALRS